MEKQQPWNLPPGGNSSHKNPNPLNDSAFSYVLATPGKIAGQVNVMLAPGLTKLEYAMIHLSDNTTFIDSESRDRHIQMVKKHAEAILKAAQ